MDIFLRAVKGLR